MCNCCGASWAGMGELREPVIAMLASKLVIYMRGPTL